MEFLAILIALALLQVWGSGGPVQRDAWFLAFRRWLGSRIDGLARQLGVVLLPGIAVVVLQAWLGGVAYGLAELALFVLVLLYSLGRGDLGSAITEYLQRWGRGDFQAAFEQLQDEGREAVAGVVETDVPDPQALHARARRRLYYRSFERLFAVLFWFVVLGPAGALVYRLAALDRAMVRAEASGEAQGLALVHWLDWLPVRLAGLGFALVADFDACTEAWRRLADDVQADAGEVLECSGNAALQFVDPDPAEETQEALIARGTRQIVAIEGLQRRALLVWLAVIALLVMII